MGRVGSGCENTATRTAASIVMGCAGAGPEATARTVADGTTVREPESLAQHIPPIESPSDAQQSSAAIWGQTKQGHSARTRLKAATANKPRRSRFSTEVTGPCITPGPAATRMQLNQRQGSEPSEVGL